MTTIGNVKWRSLELTLPNKIVKKGKSTFLEDCQVSVAIEDRALPHSHQLIYLPVDKADLS